MTAIFLDGFSAFQTHIWIIVCILLAVCWGWLLTHILLVKFFNEQFTFLEYFSLSSAGFVFPLFIWAGLFFVINFLFGKIGAIIFSSVIFIIPFFFLKIKRISPPTIGLILFFAISLIIRFAFLEKATLPSYFDSAEHYRIIKYLLGIYQSTHFMNDVFLSNYYHLGYHILISSFAHLFQLDIPDAMLIFGQVMLAILPLSFFFILKQETGSDVVAFFTCLFAGFGFHMPAHLVNWGKYPALLGLLGIQFVLMLGYFLIKKNQYKRKYYLVVLLLMAITTLIHSRSLIVFLLLVIVAFLISGYRNSSRKFQYVTIGFVGLFLAVEIFYIQQNPALSPLITGYMQRDLWTLILVLLLIPFAIKAYPNFSLFLLLSLCFFMLFLFFPIPFLNYGTQTLLDRPFVQMLAYIPLTIFAGLGFSVLLQLMRKISEANLLISFALFSFLIINAKNNYSFYPSDCCQLVSQDDLSAIAWIDKEISSDARILIASSPLYVTSFESAQTKTGADAGIWITPLTSKITLLAPVNLNFETPQTRAEICEQGVRYIYVGGMPQSFNLNQLQNQPSWYHITFDFLKTKVYRVNCQ